MTIPGETKELLDSYQKLMELACKKAIIEMSDFIERIVKNAILKVQIDLQKKNNHK